MAIKSLYPLPTPSLDLNFAAVKRLDPRVTFSRGSSATYFDSNGVMKAVPANTARFDHNPSTGDSLGLLVEEARTNLVSYSPYFINIWTSNQCSIYPNNDLAPDGTYTATKIVPSVVNDWHFISCSVTSADNRTLTLYVKAAGYTSVYFGNYQYVGTGVTVDLTTGTPSSSVTPIGNGWFRVSYSVDYPGRYIFTIHPLQRTQFAGDGTSGIYVWGAQLENGSFPTSYIPTPATFTGRASTATFYDANGVVQTAASGVARSNVFFPDSNGVMRPAGLLLEAAGTNLLAYSEQFNNGYWTLSNIKPFITGGSIIDAILSPDKQTSSEKIVENATNSTHSITKGSIITPAVSTAYTVSVFVKAAERNKLQLKMYGSFTVDPAVNFDLNNNTINIFQGNISNPSMTPIGGGWYRCSFTSTADNTNSLGIQFLLRNNDGSVFYQGDDVSGIYIWGAQLETSPYATSYIPTTTSTVTRSADTSTSSTVTRSADVAQITGTNFLYWYNQNEGTVAIKFTPKSVGVFAQWSIEGNNVRMHSYSDSLYGLFVYVDFVTQCQIAPYTYLSNVTSQTASAYKTNSFAICKDGQTVGVDNTGIVSSFADKLTLMAYGGIQIQTGHLSRLTYWPIRLPDTVLQTLTR